MQTMMIDSKNARFTALKKLLDAKIEQHRKDRKMHMMGRNTHYNEGKVELIEYIYGFSDEDGIPASVANASNDTDPTFGTNDSPVTADITSYIQEVKDAGTDELTLYQGLNNKAITEGWTVDQIATALGQPKTAVMATFEKYGINFGVVVPPPAPSPTPGGTGDPVASPPAGGDPNALPYNVGISEAEFGYWSGDISRNIPMTLMVSKVAQPGKTIRWKYVPQPGYWWGSGYGALNGVTGGTCTPSSGEVIADANGHCTWTVMGSTAGNYQFEIEEDTANAKTRTFYAQMIEHSYTFNITTDPNPVVLGKPFTFVFSDWMPNESWLATLERFAAGVFQESLGTATITMDAYGGATYTMTISVSGFYRLSIDEPGGGLAGNVYTFTVS